MTLTLTTVTSNIRTDLDDLNAASYRWVDATIQREIDRAVDRYSLVAPLLQLQQMATTAYSKLYASPSGAWFIDRVEYPLGKWPKSFQPFKERTSPLLQNPTAATGLPTLAAGSGGGQGAGTYLYAYTFTCPGGGETLPSPTTSIVLTAGQSVLLSSVPTGPYGVTGRNIYRSKAAGATLYLAGSLPDNVTSSYTDAAADSALTQVAPSSNSTQNIPQFEIQLSPYFTPQDAAGTIEVTFASKHTLDTNGTTIPEEHWDVIHLGAEAYLCTQYLGNVNDNFEWVDGQFRDRVDDTKSALAWQTLEKELTQRFADRLKEIEAQDNVTISNVSRWGDKPYRWDRL
ncbi:MAG TPA: hypothetical protein VFB58_13790 [Chloroflexota bacterium]|nr:hypothetical protein [Chloroflexota bacterium]